LFYKSEILLNSIETAIYGRKNLVSPKLCWYALREISWGSHTSPIHREEVWASPVFVFYSPFHSLCLSGFCLSGRTGRARPLVRQHRLQCDPRFSQALQNSAANSDDRRDATIWNVDFVGTSGGPLAPGVVTDKEKLTPKQLDKR
jgi:hypothetical protein